MTVIKGKGFQQSGGGFEQLIVDGKEVSPTRVARALEVADLVDFYFQPWGAAKAARWEEITGDNGPLSDEAFLKYLKGKLDGQDDH